MKRKKPNKDYLGENVIFLKGYKKNKKQRKNLNNNVFFNEKIFLRFLLFAFILFCIYNIYKRIKNSSQKGKILETEGGKIIQNIKNSSQNEKILETEKNKIIPNIKNSTEIKNDTNKISIKQNFTLDEAKKYLLEYINSNFTEKDLETFEKNENPAISIIIPCYNGEKYIIKLVKYLQNQSFQNIEIIFINDFSKDNSENIIQSIQKIDKRIVYIKNEKNEGSFRSRNRGAIEAKGKYIQFLDVDDLIFNDILAKAYVVAENKNIDIVQYTKLKGTSNFLYHNEKTKNGIIYQPELSDLMYYGGGYLRQVIFFIINKLIKKTTFMETLDYIGEDTLKENLSINEDCLTLFFLLRVGKSLTFIDDFGYAYFFGINTNSSMSGFLNPSNSNKIYHDTFTELRLIFKKTQNNEHDKAVCIEYLNMIKKLYSGLTNSLTEGFALYNEVFDLLLNSQYFRENTKNEFRAFKNLVMKNYKM